MGIWLMGINFSHLFCFVFLVSGKTLLSKQRNGKTLNCLVTWKTWASKLNFFLGFFLLLFLNN